MGHSIFYHRHNPTSPQYLTTAGWYAGFTTTDKHQRAPAMPDYAVGKEAAAADAIKRARETAQQAADAEDAVIGQAVYALSKQGRSLRYIADKLDMKKSTVGRVLRKVSDSTTLIPLQVPGFLRSFDQVRNLVHDAWYPPYVHAPEISDAMNTLYCLLTATQYDQRDEAARWTMTSVVAGILIERNEYRPYSPDGIRVSPSGGYERVSVSAGNSLGDVKRLAEEYRAVFGDGDAERRENKILDALRTAESWKRRVDDDQDLVGELDFAIDMLQWGLDNPRPEDYHPEGRQGSE